MKRKLASILMVMCMMAGILSGCGNSDVDDDGNWYDPEGCWPTPWGEHIDCVKKRILTLWDVQV